MRTAAPFAFDESFASTGIGLDISFIRFRDEQVSRRPRPAYCVGNLCLVRSLNRLSGFHSIHMKKRRFYQHKGFFFHNLKENVKTHETIYFHYCIQKYGALGRPILDVIDLHLDLVL